ncbi:MAG: PRC-barrel domain-containing protein [Patescibacteria group bacterium]
MKISNKQIQGMIVETQAGDRLGKVESFNIDIDSQSVLEYVVKPSSLTAGLIKGDLIISRGQVIEITKKKMIVEDLEIKNNVLVKKENKQKIAQGAIMKES